MREPNYHITEMPDIRKPEVWPEKWRDTPETEPEPPENQDEIYPYSSIALHQIEP